MCCIVYAIFGTPESSSTEGMVIGLSSGFGVTGILGILTCIKYLKNPKKADEVEIYKNEERSVFIKQKANSLVYTVFIYIESVTIIITGLLGYKVISMTLAILVLLKVIFYIACLQYYSKKY
jgi:hypothetical protein